MIADAIVKVAGTYKSGRGNYYPRPSIAGPEQCIRKLTYWATGVPEDREIGDRFVMTMDDSSWHEELTGDWIQKTAFKLHSQQMAVDTVSLDFIPKYITRYCHTCKKKHPASFLHGHIDGILTDPMTDDYHYEHKALNTFGWDRYWKHGEWPLDYFTQCSLYQIGVRRVNPDVKKSVLLIKNKNTAVYMEYVLEYDDAADECRVLSMCNSSGEARHGEPFLYVMPGVVAGVRERFALIDRHAREETLPPRPYQVGTEFPCGYCGYEPTCWEGYEEEFGQLHQDVALTQEEEEAARYYLEVNGHISELEKQKDEIRDRFRAFLVKEGIMTARAGAYVLQRRLQKERRPLKVEDIPAKLLPLVTREGMKEVFTIRKPKPKKEKCKNG